MANRAYAVCEALILVLLGAGILWFAWSANYGLLMNLNFRWLTFAGAGSLLVMGLIYLTGPSKRSGLNSVFFGLMLLIVFVGKPYLPSENLMVQPEASLQKGLWAQIDQSRFPRKELYALCTTEAGEVFRSGQPFTTVGIAKRLETLDSHGSFSLMTTYMYCCVADMFAIGLRVPHEDWRNIKDGQWLMVSGRLVKEELDLSLPNFRLGRAMLASINKEYYLKPERIMSYDRIDQLPTLAEKLAEKSNSLFSRAVKQSGLWESLQKDGPFTVFMPVDQAIEDAWESPLDNLSQSELKRLVSPHIVKGKYYVQDLMNQQELETISGQALRVTLSNAKIRINQSRLLFKNTEARNGVIHFIYPAILPDD